MDPALVAELCSLKDDKNAAINTKVSQMMTLLEKHGHLYHQLLSPSQLLVHPANRCGMLINSFDAHEKGYRALSVGFDASKLTESVCFEVAKEGSGQGKASAEQCQACGRVGQPTCPRVALGAILDSVGFTRVAVLQGCR